MSIIHARRRPDGTFVYRLWNTSCDQYETDELDEASALDRLKVQFGYDLVMHLERWQKEQPPRFARARHHGTSSMDARALDSPWETERCNVCGGFHHAFEDGMSDWHCARCGEPRASRPHGPPCEDAEPVR